MAITVPAQCGSFGQTRRMCTAIASIARNRISARATCVRISRKNHKPPTTAPVAKIKIAQIAALVIGNAPVYRFGPEFGLEGQALAALASLAQTAGQGMFGFAL